MSYDAMVSSVDTLTYEEQVNLMSVILQAIKKHGNSDIESSKNDSAKRTLGGLEQGFWISEDFDETPDCLKDYV